MKIVWLAGGLDEVPAGDGWMSPAEADRASRMRYPKRRTEFRLGRWNAKQALARVTGFDRLDAIEIRHHLSGAPAPHIGAAAFPGGLSMTDRADWAVCVVTTEPGAALGTDLELVEPRSARFVADYFTAAEQDLVAGEATDVYANLIWSAKESALKVLTTGLRRDTRTVEVRPAPERPGEWAQLEVADVSGRVFPGWWRRFGPFLLTVAADRPHGPPESLVAPSPLAAAVPSHRWLDPS